MKSVGTTFYLLTRHTVVSSVGFKGSQPLLCWHILPVFYKYFEILIHDDATNVQGWPNNNCWVLFSVSFHSYFFLLGNFLASLKLEQYPFDSLLSLQKQGLYTILHDVIFVPPCKWLHSLNFLPYKLQLHTKKYYNNRVPTLT